tara:strand:- start:98 stop:9100 length:9003 start_codon:yes stop_codon:yes gene_type:complete
MQSYELIVGSREGAVSYFELDPTAQLKGAATESAKGERVNPMAYGSGTGKGYSDKAKSGAEQLLWAEEQAALRGQNYVTMFIRTARVVNTPAEHAALDGWSLVYDRNESTTRALHTLSDERNTTWPSQTRTQRMACNVSVEQLRSAILGIPALQFAGVNGGIDVEVTPRFTRVRDLFKGYADHTIGMNFSTTASGVSDANIILTSNDLASAGKTSGEREAHAVRSSSRRLVEEREWVVTLIGTTRAGNAALSALPNGDGGSSHFVHRDDGVAGLDAAAARLFALDAISISDDVNAMSDVSHLRRSDTSNRDGTVPRNYSAMGLRFTTCSAATVGITNTTRRGGGVDASEGWYYGAARGVRRARSVIETAEEAKRLIQFTPCFDFYEGKCKYGSRRGEHCVPDTFNTPLFPREGEAGKEGGADETVGRSSECPCGAPAVPFSLFTPTNKLVVRYASGAKQMADWCRARSEGLASAPANTNDETVGTKEHGTGLAFDAELERGSDGEGDRSSGISNGGASGTQTRDGWHAGKEVVVDAAARASKAVGWAGATSWSVQMHRGLTNLGELCPIGSYCHGGTSVYVATPEGATCAELRPDSINTVSKRFMYRATKKEYEQKYVKEYMIAYVAAGIGGSIYDTEEDAKTAAIERGTMEWNLADPELSSPPSPYMFARRSFPWTALPSDAGRTYRADWSYGLDGRAGRDNGMYSDFAQWRDGGYASAAAEESRVTPCICDEGFYCKQGTSSPKKATDEYVVIDGIQNVCFSGYVCTAGSIFPQGQNLCPRGYYCVGLEEIPCDLGHMCDIEGLNQPKICPPGTFQNATMQQRCLVCPVGYFCPMNALIAPVPCYKGAVCDQEGLVQPANRCPPGAWCPPGLPTYEICEVKHKCGVEPLHPNDWSLRGGHWARPGDTHTPFAGSDAMHRPGTFDAMPSWYPLKGDRNDHFNLRNGTPTYNASSMQWSWSGEGSEGHYNYTGAFNGSSDEHPTLLGVPIGTAPGQVWPWPFKRCVGGANHTRPCTFDEECAAMSEEPLHACKQFTPFGHIECAIGRCLPEKRCVSGLRMGEECLDDEMCIDDECNGPRPCPAGTYCLGGVAERELRLSGGKYGGQVDSKIEGYTNYSFAYWDREGWLSSQPAGTPRVTKIEDEYLLLKYETVEVPLTRSSFPYPCAQGAVCPIGSASPQTPACPAGFFCPNLRVLLATNDGGDAGKGLIHYLGSYFPGIFGCGSFPCEPGGDECFDVKPRIGWAMKWTTSLSVNGGATFTEGDLPLSSSPLPLCRDREDDEILYNPFSNSNTNNAEGAGSSESYDSGGGAFDSASAGNTTSGSDNNGTDVRVKVDFTNLTYSSGQLVSHIDTYAADGSVLSRPPRDEKCEAIIRAPTASDGNLTITFTTLDIEPWPYDAILVYTKWDRTATWQTTNESSPTGVTPVYNPEWLAAKARLEQSGAITAGAGGADSAELDKIPKYSRVYNQTSIDTWHANNMSDADGRKSAQRAAWQQAHGIGDIWHGEERGWRLVANFSGPNRRGDAAQFESAYDRSREPPSVPFSLSTSTGVFKIKWISHEQEFFDQCKQRELRCVGGRRVGMTCANESLQAADCPYEISKPPKKCELLYGTSPFDPPPARVGHYVPIEGASSDTLCRPGTYSDSTGAPNCTKCLKGFVCRQSGVVSPQLCTRGYICSTKGSDRDQSNPGLSTPQSRCTPGYSCLEGTDTFELGREFTQSSERQRDLQFGRSWDRWTISDKSARELMVGIVAEGIRPSDRAVKEWRQNASRTEFTWLRSDDVWSEMPRARLEDDPVWRKHSVVKNTSSLIFWCDDDAALRRTCAGDCHDSSPNADGVAFGPRAWAHCLAKCSYQLSVQELRGMYACGPNWRVAPKVESLYAPKPCFNGTYCLAGVGMHVPMADLTPATAGVTTFPQKCTEGYYCGSASVDYQGRPLGGKCRMGHYCPAGSSIETPAQLGRFVGSPGSFKASLCVRGRYADKRGSSACAACPGGRFSSEGGAVRCDACPAGKYLTATNAEIRGYACDNCPKGKYLSTSGADAESWCLKTPAGYSCKLDGLASHPANSTKCTTCPAGFFCPPGTSGASDQITCPEGFFCNTGAAFKTLVKQVVDFDDALDMPGGLCPARYSCPEGTTFKAKQPCGRKFYCPEGTGRVQVMCPPGTESELLCGHISCCAISNSWLNDPLTGGYRVISLNPATPRRYRLDPQGWHQNEDKWQNPPVLKMNDIQYVLKMNTFDLAKLTFDFTSAHEAGLVYDRDFRVAIFVRNNPKSRFKLGDPLGPDPSKDDQTSVARQVGEVIRRYGYETIDTIEESRAFEKGGWMEDDPNLAEICYWCLAGAQVPDIDLYSAEESQAHAAAANAAANADLYSASPTLYPTPFPSLSPTPTPTTEAMASSTYNASAAITDDDNTPAPTAASEPLEPTPGPTARRDTLRPTPSPTAWQLHGIKQMPGWETNNLDVRYADPQYATGFPLKRWAYPTDSHFTSRKNVPPFMRTAPYVDIYSTVCLPWCKAQRTKLAPTVEAEGYASDPPRGYGPSHSDSDPTIVRYPLPKSLKRVNYSLARVTSAAAAAIAATNFLELQAFARVPVELIVELHLLNGTAYEHVFDTFHNSLLTSSADNPEAPIPSVRQPTQPAGSSFIIVLRRESVYELPLNLHSFFDHRTTPRTQGAAQYAINSADLRPYPPVSSGEHVVLLSYLQPNVGGQWGGDRTGLMWACPQWNDTYNGLPSTSYTKDKPRGDWNDIVYDCSPEVRVYRPGHYLPSHPDPVASDGNGGGEHDRVKWDFNLFWNTKTVATLPYLPYISNCAGYDSFLPFFQLVEDNRCRQPLSGVNPTVEWYKFWDWGVLSVVEDSHLCNLNFTCSLEESIEGSLGSSDKLRWFEATTDDFLFYITRTRMLASIWGTEMQEGDGDSQARQDANMLRDPATDNLLYEEWNSVPVVVGRACVDLSSDPASGRQVVQVTPEIGTVPRLAYPSVVHLVVSYWQKADSNGVDDKVCG